MKQGVDCGVETEGGWERMGLGERREGTLQLGYKENKFIKKYLSCVHIWEYNSHIHTLEMRWVMTHSNYLRQVSITLTPKFKSLSVQSTFL